MDQLLVILPIASRQFSIAGARNVYYSRKMVTKAVLPPSLGYQVEVTERDGQFQLRVRELMITVRAASLQGGYDMLLARKSEMLEWAATIGATADIPPPKAPPPLYIRRG